MARVAFIGLGNMGGGMAANLAAKGHEVRAFDLSAEALERAKGKGCTPVNSAEEALDGAEAVVSMLPAGKHVADVYHNAVFAKAPKSAILMDCSTIDVATAQKRRPRGRGGRIYHGGRASFGRDSGRRRRNADLHGWRVGRRL